MLTRTALTMLVCWAGLASAGLAQGQSTPGSTMDPPKLDTGRYGNPTSTARAYQNFKLGILKEIRKDELVIDKTSFGDNQLFKITPKTKFLQDSQKSDVSALKVGDQVFINVKTNKKTFDLILDTVAWGVVGKNMKGEGVK